MQLSDGPQFVRAGCIIKETYRHNCNCSQSLRQEMALVPQCLYHPSRSPEFPLSQDWAEAENPEEQEDSITQLHNHNAAVEYRTVNYSINHSESHKMFFSFGHCFFNP